MCVVITSVVFCCSFLPLALLPSKFIVKKMVATVFTRISARGSYLIYGHFREALIRGGGGGYYIFTILVTSL